LVKWILVVLAQVDVGLDLLLLTLISLEMVKRGKLAVGELHSLAQRINYVPRFRLMAAQISYDSRHCIFGVSV
jgi:hypothetical protein